MYGLATPYKADAAGDTALTIISALKSIAVILPAKLFTLSLLSL